MKAFLVINKIMVVALMMTALTIVAGFINNPERTLANPTTKADAADTSGWPKTFGIGRTATVNQISAINISIRPDGTGLPAGSGTAASGQKIYELKCVACHGQQGTGGIGGKLVGVFGDTVKTKTIGNYWPYATTLFDYIRRAMPFNQPGSLSNNEVYSLAAYLLYKNKITAEAEVINASGLPKVKMPAQSLFVADDRRGGSEIR